MSFTVVCVLFLATMASGIDVGPVRRECRDTFSSCSSWSKAGMCDNKKFGFVMRGGCAKTCGFCTGKENIPKKKLNLSFHDIHSIVVQDDHKKMNKVVQDKATTKHKQKAIKSDKSSTNTGLEALVTYSTITTATTATTPTTATTAPTVSSAPDVVVDVDKPGKDADSQNNKNCKDVFKRCKLWNEQTSICERPAFKSYMNYGCKKTCNLCGSSAESQRKATIQTGPENLEKGTKKTLLEIWPNMDSDDAKDEIKNSVEVGISREINDAKITTSSKRDKIKPKSLSKKIKKASKRGKAHKNSQLVHKTKGKRQDKRSKIRRVEIETGYKNPRPFASFEEGDTMPLPDRQNSEAVNAFGKSLNTADGFNGLAKLPDFDGVNDVVGVENLLETPKPNKKLDYYVEHFSKDPYVAYSEQEDWMKENDLHLKKYRRRLHKVPKGSKRSSKKRSKTGKKNKRETKDPLKSNSKKVEIENGLKDDSTPFATANEIANGIDKVNYHMAEANSDDENPIFPDSQLLKPDFISQLRKLPYFEGLDKDDAEKSLARAKIGKGFEYYVERFSKDPYLAESEREEWMKDNEVRPKSYRRKTIEVNDKRKKQS